MLKNILTVLLVISSMIVSAQKIVKGKVVDATTKEILEGATIVVKNSKKGTETNALGVFKIKVSNANSVLVVSYLGYKPQEVLASSIKGIIYLEQSTGILENIVVSASRIRQKREDVPVAINTITPHVLADVKPNTIDEVLNQVPGVLMVPLGGEQHMMAIRQPISTKSVFLYLEDGVPIRPTGVFNHNALLEMNMAAVQNIEVIRGPYSSLYGSEAIGGAINFITAIPTAKEKGNVSVRMNDIGYRRIDAKYSNIFGKLGVLFAGYKSATIDGFTDYGDNKKTAFTGKITYRFSDKLFWSNLLTYIDYYSEMSGSIGEAKFLLKDFSSNHTFTYRDAKALRFNSTIKYKWSTTENTSLTFINRVNSMGQNPSYRISNRTRPNTYTKGQINDNSFTSFGLIAQHNIKYDKAKLNIGASVDYSPNTYEADKITVFRNAAGIFESYTMAGVKLSDYKVNLFNLGIYASGEYDLSSSIKINAGIRVDQFNYNFTNYLGAGAADYKAPNTTNSFTAVTPRVGLLYKMTDKNGMYANFSNGFIPPSVGELYRKSDVPLLDPATFNNYEIGNWMRLFNNKLYLELGAYYMKGKNEVVSVTTITNGEETRENKNVGETEHYGLEYLLKIKPIEEVSLRFSGSYSKHKYVNFVVKINEGVETAYSGNDMPGAPDLVANSELIYKPNFLNKKMLFGLEWQHVGTYFTDQKNTITYNGYDVFNGRIGYKTKAIYTWIKVNNLTDKLYSPRVSTAYGKTSYTPGAPISFNLGIEFNIF